VSIPRFVCTCAVAATLAILPAAQRRPSELQMEGDVKLPSGKSQRDEILKMEHKKSLADVAKILDLAGELQAELEKDDYIVLSISSLKKAEEIEKLAKRIHKRLKR
jgi:hypothetical protein